LHIVAYTVVLLPVSLLPWMFGVAGLFYAVTAGVLGLGFLVAALRVLMDRQDASGVSQTGDKPARAAFRYSLVYLALLFMAVAVDAAI
jgi:protoheme IX farnesyltransferase